MSLGERGRGELGCPRYVMLSSTTAHNCGGVRQWELLHGGLCIKLNGLLFSIATWLVLAGYSVTFQRGRTVKIFKLKISRLEQHMTKPEKMARS